MTASPAARHVTRVLVVDDSVVARQSIARAIEADDELELAGVAANGRRALDQLSVARPDVLVLDLEMPVMNGLETLSALQSSHPDLPVVVFSSYTARGAAETLEAMALGAAAFALKPGALGGDAAQSLRSELVPLIKAVARSSTATWHASTPNRVPASRAGVSVVVVAVSTGGPNALAGIVGSLPRDLAVPILIVQHMPPVFTATLAQRLGRQSQVSVMEGAEGDLVRPGSVYLAPGGFHMEVVRRWPNTRITLNQGPLENSCRPSADVLFRSAVHAYGSGVLGVVLTGMGHDGLRGSEAIHAAGGAVIVQDPRTAVVGSMPGAVAEAGLADDVLALDRIAADLVRRVEGSAR